MNPSTGTRFPVIPDMHTLLFRLLLAIASIVAYAGLVQLTPFLEALDGVPYAGTAFHLAVGAIFGALVMAPYASAPHRTLRGIALAAASAAIYYFTIRFVVGGPAGLSALATFVVAGAVGGAVFESRISFDPALLLGHAAWQLLVCVALSFGQRNAPT